ncbi:MAG: hypothetical protein JRE64_04515 [Deltaproteobacteria bacterium]|nr:hypothetical protein [Deltaproteobacteria bacterium]
MDEGLSNWILATGESDSCRVDAMQHCIGGGIASAKCGSICAIFLGGLLELTHHPEISGRDLYNNFWGAACGVFASNNQDVVDCCESLLDVDFLWTSLETWEMGGTCH